jgi:hypothetical protein
MAVRTTAKGEIEIIAEANQIGEGVVLAVVEDAADVADGDLRRLGGRQGGKAQSEGEENGLHEDGMRMLKTVAG